MVAIEPTATYRAPEVARRMAEAAASFLAKLSEGQREVARFPFEGDERYAWDYRPTPRNGLRLINMTHDQQAAAWAVVDVGLSARGAGQARQIVELEPILRESERAELRLNRWVRDAELYWFSVFGEPGGSAPWAWRAGGHHLGLHFTVVDRELVAPTPLFFGANPARVRHGPKAGYRTLPEEEDLARALLVGLEADRRAVAQISETAPRDLLTEWRPRVEPGILPVGLAYEAMGGEDRERLVGLIRHYVERTAVGVAANEWARIERAGLEPITFAWAGPDQPGQGHYYAIQGPTFMIEYDNTQNEANHIHSVWRNFTNDWGEDLLAAHYAAAHRP
jgi:hypothetical protein